MPDNIIEKYWFSLSYYHSKKVMDIFAWALVCNRDLVNQLIIILSSSSKLSSSIYCSRDGCFCH